MTSREVNWATVLEFVQRQGIDPTRVLIAGTPAWAALPDDHPDKLAAVLVAGLHHVLRLDLAQAAQAEASRAVAGTPDVDWARIGRPKPPSYIPRKAS